MLIYRVAASCEGVSRSWFGGGVRRATLRCVAFRSACKWALVVLKPQVGENMNCNIDAIATMIRYARPALDVLAGCWIGGNNGKVGLKLPVPSSR